MSQGSHNPRRHRHIGRHADRCRITGRRHPLTRYLHVNLLRLALRRRSWPRIPIDVESATPSTSSSPCLRCSPCCPGCGADAKRVYKAPSLAVVPRDVARGGRYGAGERGSTAGRPIAPAVRHVPASRGGVLSPAPNRSTPPNGLPGPTSPCLGPDRGRRRVALRGASCCS